MQFSSALLESAVSEFARLPGIGKKTALRLVLHLLKAEASSVQGLSEALTRMRQEIKFCQRCYNIADADICSICSNSLRKQSSMHRKRQWTIRIDSGNNRYTRFGTL